MKLSTATRYGLRALSDLCARQGNAPVAVGDIARRQEIPPSYLEQLFAKLRRGHVLKSIRGAQGGYVLARPANEITIAEIIEALGEPIIFGDCQTKAGCDRTSKCSAYGLWRRLKDSVDGILQDTTLADVMRGMRDEFPDQKEFFAS